MVVRQKEPVLNHPDTKCLVCSKAPASLTPHLGALSHLLPAWLPQQVKLLAQPVGSALSVDHFVKSVPQVQALEFYILPQAMLPTVLLCLRGV